MKYPISEYYPELIRYCRKQFNDINCEDVVGDFIIKVLSKDNFYPDTIKNSDEAWAWTKTCFRRFKIDKMRHEKVRFNILNTVSVTGLDSGLFPSINFTNIPEVECFLSREEYRNHLIAYFPDEILIIYGSLPLYDQRIFQLLILCRLDIDETTKLLKETESITKRDVVLSFKRIKEKLKNHGAKNY